MNKRVTPGSVARAVLVFLVVLVASGLFVYILVSSFKPLKEIMARARFFPQEPTLDNFRKLFQTITSNKNFPRYLGNSILVSVCSAAASCVISSLAAYGFSRHVYFGKNALLNSMLFLYVFPTIILQVPLYKSFSALGLVDNYLSLIISYAGLTTPFCTWILVSFFNRVPRALEEASYVDGATKFQALIHIVIPVAVPGLIMVLAYSFITAWGEYMFASILIRSNLNRTVTQALVDFTADQYVEWGMLLAGSVVVLVPVLAMFLPVAKNFIKGFTAGAVKE